jgi:hypothetical protein
MIQPQGPRNMGGGTPVLSCLPPTFKHAPRSLNLVFRAHTSRLFLMDLLRRPGGSQLLHQGVFQLLNHDHTVNPVHERDIRVYNISTVDSNK